MALLMQVKQCLFSGVTGWHWAHVGGWAEQARRALADHSQQAAEETRPGPLLARNSEFVWVYVSVCACVDILKWNTASSFYLCSWIKEFCDATEMLMYGSIFFPGTSPVQLLCLVGEAFDDYSDEVCGAVVNIRTKGDKIAIWTADFDNREAITHIG